MDWKSLPVSVFFGGLDPRELPGPIWAGSSALVLATPGEMGRLLLPRREQVGTFSAPGSQGPSASSVWRKGPATRRPFRGGSTITPQLLLLPPVADLRGIPRGRLVPPRSTRAMSPLIRYAPGDFGPGAPLCRGQDILTPAGVRGPTCRNFKTPWVSVLGRKGKDVPRQRRPTRRQKRSGGPVSRSQNGPGPPPGISVCQAAGTTVWRSRSIAETFSPTEELKKYIDRIARFVHVDFDVTLHPYASSPLRNVLNYGNKFQYV